MTIYLVICNPCPEEFDILSAWTTIARANEALKVEHDRVKYELSPAPYPVLKTALEAYFIQAQEVQS